MSCPQRTLTSATWPSTSSGSCSSRLRRCALWHRSVARMSSSWRRRRSRSPAACCAENSASEQSACTWRKTAAGGVPGAGSRSATSDNTASKSRSRPQASRWCAAANQAAAGAPPSARSALRRSSRLTLPGSRRKDTPFRGNTSAIGAAVPPKLPCALGGAPQGARNGCRTACLL